MPSTFGIVDLFAGPGGLGEGFAAAGREGDGEMEIRLSVERQSIEVQTVRLRAFLRQFENGFPKAYHDALNSGSPMPDWSDLHPAEWKAAEAEARQLELGAEGSFDLISDILDRTREELHGDTILIGGPPCQAYSLAGRSRNRGKQDYVPEKDDRHYLYREYVRILDRLRPAVFVMENVKGMISSSVDGGGIFQRVLEDLAGAGDGYHLLPLAQPRGAEPFKGNDFLVRAEEHGIPQARHRVFVVGLRRDISPPLRHNLPLSASGQRRRPAAELSAPPDRKNSNVSSTEKLHSCSNTRTVSQKRKVRKRWGPGRAYGHLRVDPDQQRLPLAQRRVVTGPVRRAIAGGRWLAHAVRVTA